MSPARTRRSGRRTDYHWHGISASSIDFAIGTVQTILFAVTDLGGTIMRVRGDLVVGFGATGSTDGDAVAFAAGIMLGQTGSTFTSTPLTDPQAPWMWYSTGVLLEGAAGRGEAVTAGFRGVIDGKAMRRFQGGDQSLFLIFETADIVGAPTVSFGVSGRVLVGT